MKILYAYRYGILGGVCTQIWNRLRRLSQHQNCEVHCAFRTDYGVSRFLNSYATLHFGIDANALLKLTQKYSYDSVIVIDTPEYFEAIGRDHGRDYAFVAEVHTSIANNLSYLDDRSWAPDRFVVPSRYMKDLLTSQFLSDAEEVHICANSLDMALFQKTAPKFQTNAPVVLWVGKIDDHKDWRSFLTLCYNLTSSGMAFDIWMVGGETCSPAVALDLLNFADSLNLLDRLRWIDRVEHDVMPEIYSAVSDSGGLSVATTHNESFGMSILEALCCGCPVVATEVGAIPEFKLGRNGSYLRLYALGDLQKAADHAADLLTEQTATAARVALATDRDLFVERFGIKNATDRYLETLQVIRQNRPQKAEAGSQLASS
ncbi:MAG: hypothetical protein CMM50_15025 [Rhodospirillaceae bacterium]|nr:hypothetical protein [Rhodospirillaceae bacterium]|tara:strand:+ start:375 stop:1496 length:1122 start_codon:yes stop_codon:yes gene_type:complete